MQHNTSWHKGSLIILACLASISAGISALAADDDIAIKKAAPAHRWALTSPELVDKQKMPTQYTADGVDLSPPLTWSAPPAATQTLVIICDDPDAPAGTWVHWIIYNIAASSRSLSAAVPPETALSSGAIQGTNSFGKVGYNGPSPPPGTPHHYFFKLYSLDRKLNLAPGAKKAELLKAMQDHVLSEAKLMVTYGR